MPGFQIVGLLIGRVDPVQPRSRGPVGSPRRVSKAIVVPSGDQLGAPSYQPRARVIRVRAPPTLTVLQSMFALAVAEDETGQLSNPVDKVKKPPLEVARELAPLPPLTVQRLRARLELRDATLVIGLGYGGLRPEELLALHAEDIVAAGIRVHRKNVDGKLLPYTKTRRNRTGRRAPPQLRQDLRT